MPSELVMQRRIHTGHSMLREKENRALCLQLATGCDALPRTLMRKHVKKVGLSSWKCRSFLGRDGEIASVCLSEWDIPQTKRGRWGDPIGGNGP